MTGTAEGSGSDSHRIQGAALDATRTESRQSSLESTPKQGTLVQKTQVPWSKKVCLLLKYSAEGSTHLSTVAGPQSL